ncbi:16S rRNA (guanine(527)-N(7))-methyltransferase RsmG [Tropicibacter oceani]|uniref:Ribosomal RNA small subunit methyltransferase G n=1 Tax=Tropicibacter oceani TaxID=3058420 RepID=A0ABY8QJ96_9RHOB|nr:16S rRNA (guanine(527)-N(7))-methyltransferase RsmG [Tropicibacter oceani]WGW04585.1 16S rRNA (guanine(527)-N(7))-methyltransferase RsmG [Tropicibacter oceani]
MSDLSKAIGADVSRETKDRLNTYLELLRTWNPKINLVSPSTLDAAWERHILDSAQIFGHAPKSVETWVDLGSGGGFPGLVIAILAAEKAPDMAITLIESDARKSTFLRTVIRETGTAAKVLTQRIEVAPPQNAQVVSARALAPLPLLLDYVRRHIAPDGTALLQKGASWKNEMSRAQESWKFRATPHKSITDPNSVILEIGEIAHV